VTVDSERLTAAARAEAQKKLAAERCEEDHYEFKDIRAILEDDLFKIFVEKLEGTDYEDQKQKKMRDVAIRAMVEARS